MRTRTCLRFATGWGGDSATTMGRTITSPGGDSPLPRARAVAATRASDMATRAAASLPGLQRAATQRRQVSPRPRRREYLPTWTTHPPFLSSLRSDDDAVAVAGAGTCAASIMGQATCPPCRSARATAIGAGGVPSEGAMASGWGGGAPDAADATAALLASPTTPTTGAYFFHGFSTFWHSQHSPRPPLLHGTGSRARDNGDGRWGRGAGLWSSGGCRGPGIPGAVCGRLTQQSKSRVSWAPPAPVFVQSTVGTGCGGHAAWGWQRRGEADGCRASAVATDRGRSAGRALSGSFRGTAVSEQRPEPESPGRSPPQYHVSGNPRAPRPTLFPLFTRRWRARRQLRERAVGRFLRGCGCLAVARDWVSRARPETGSPGRGPKSGTSSPPGRLFFPFFCTMPTAGTSCRGRAA